MNVMLGSGNWLVVRRPPGWGSDPVAVNEKFLSSPVWATFVLRWGRQAIDLVSQPPLTHWHAEEFEETTAFLQTSWGIFPMLSYIGRTGDLIDNSLCLMGLLPCIYISIQFNSNLLQQKTKLHDHFANDRNLIHMYRKTRPLCIFLRRKAQSHWLSHALLKLVWEW